MFYILWALLSFSSFATPSPQEYLPQFSVQESLFSNSLENANIEFLESTKSLKALGIPVKIKHVGNVALNGQALDIPVAYLPGDTKSKKIFVITSGVHGAEAPTGSALQISLLNSLIQMKKEHGKALPFSLLLVHGVNPYGFATGRRVNENNVDLNRNFLLSGKKYGSSNPAYSSLRRFLNPEETIHYNFWYKATFVIKGAWRVLKQGINTLRQAILGGQYQHPKGIYFGGSEMQESAKVFKELLDHYKKDYDTFFHVDLHTGYGERGQLHFFSNTSLKGQALQKAEAMFSGFAIDRGDDKDFYHTSGDITDFTAHYLENKTVFPMTFEFGTQDSQTLRGSFFSLRSLIAENQAFHYGVGSEQSLQRIRDDFQELFNPQNSEWRQKVLRQARESLGILFYRFSQEPK